MVLNFKCAFTEKKTKTWNFVFFCLNISLQFFVLEIIFPCNTFFILSLLVIMVLDQLKKNMFLHTQELPKSFIPTTVSQLKLRSSLKMGFRMRCISFSQSEN